MALKIFELVSSMLVALVGGMYWGPWLALSRTFAALEPQVLLPVVRQMSRNMARIMTLLVPAALLSILPVTFLSFHAQPLIFLFSVLAFALLALTLLVTVLIEVPIVMQMEKWTAETLPADWQQLRDRWGAFHLARVVPALLSLGFLVAGAVF